MNKNSLKAIERKNSTKLTDSMSNSHFNFEKPINSINKKKKSLEDIGSTKRFKRQCYKRLSLKGRARSSIAISVNVINF
jgi:hypothetical protein